MGQAILLELSGVDLLPDWLTGVVTGVAPFPPRLDDATARGVLWDAAPGRFLLDVPDAARYLVTDGRRVSVAPAPHADGGTIARFFRMTPLAALFFQRGVMALHAAAACSHQGAVIVAGPSGAGKSTLVAALLQTGWTLLSDELTVVDVDAQGRLQVFPTFPELHLWPDAAAELGVAGDEPAGPGRSRLVWRRPCALAPQSLHAIYDLTASPQVDSRQRSLTGAQRFGAVGKLMYNSRIADALLDRAAYLAKAAALAALPWTRLWRPRGRWNLEELVAAVRP